MLHLKKEFDNQIVFLSNTIKHLSKAISSIRHPTLPRLNNLHRIYTNQTFRYKGANPITYQVTRCQN